MMKIVALAVLGLLVLSGNALAQVPPEAQGFVGFNAGYSVSRIKDFDETYDGWGLGLAFDSMVSSKFSLGATLAYIGGNKQLSGEEVQNREISSSYTAMPMVITGKFYFGGEKIFGYLGGGVGAHIGTFKNEIDNPDGTFERHDKRVTSFSFSVPVGVYILVGNNTFLNLGYLPYFVVENELVDGATHTFVFGVVGTI